MKLRLIAVAMLAVTVMLSSCAKEEIQEKATTPETTIELTDITYADLQKIVGDNILIEDDGMIAPDETIRWYGELPEAADVKAGCNGSYPNCNSLQGAVAQLQGVANQCCCTFRYGYICCNNNGSILAVLFLVTPNNPNCN